LESWWRRLEPRSGDKRRVFEDKLEGRSIGRRAGERGVDDLVVSRERGVDVGWVGVAVVVMRCAILRVP
jgi:hypothetical protein